MNPAPKLSFSCPVSWDSMSGAEARRFCEKCGKHVHNLSVMPAEERRVVLEKAGIGEGVCVSYLKRADGGMIVPENTPTAKILRYGLAAGVAASALSLAACSGPANPPSPTDSQPQEISRLGGVVCPDYVPPAKTMPESLTLGRVAAPEPPPQRLTGAPMPSDIK